MTRNILLVALGGALGSSLRYITWLITGTKEFPLSTFIVNIIGCFIIGLVLAISMKNEGFELNWKLFLATGICGGFTTFSAFSLENFHLIQNGKYLLCLLYITASVVLGIVATWGGYMLGGKC